MKTLFKDRLMVNLCNILTKIYSFKPHSTYTWVFNFGPKFDPKLTVRLIRGSTYTRVYTVVRLILCLTIVNFPSNIIWVQHPNFWGCRTTSSRTSQQSPLSICLKVNALSLGVSTVETNQDRDRDITTCREVIFQTVETFSNNRDVGFQTV